MSKKLEFWGVLCTVIYLLLIATTVLFKLDDFLKLELNALGDFLAGAFGPVAFLWLVLGFLQQGRELKLSSDALHLQAKELKNSVEQQQSIVRIATDQLMMSKSSLEPKFVLQYSSYLTEAGGVLFSFNLSNVGHLTSQVKLAWEKGEVENFPIFPHGETKEFMLRVPDPQKNFGISLFVSYSVGMGESDTKSFRLSFHKSLAYENQWTVTQAGPFDQEPKPD
ncbi:hypothetical protein HU811_01925 [Pseudomonas sp. SWRI196]|uniref:Uncharacterized protein n=1 Tax=Pseudomonas tehranensis TaxID=2745502 RepID=A0ABR6ULB0_9PSED|nr:hypothetical protein [Pseudomonas tehranensis]MBC3345391.1 hypothetical protein [Pseudomonas tehranensis]